MYGSLEEICRTAHKKGLPFWKVIQENDCVEEGIDETTSFARMLTMYEVMRCSRDEYNKDLHSESGLTGDEAWKLHEYRESGNMITGDYIACVMETALRVASCNACMRRIVAAPTAGSSGVLPAVLLPFQDMKHCSDEKMAEALYVAGGIGGVIAKRATLAGADGGCQAEIGSASAMAAGALVYLQGGDNKQIVNAAALALKGLLGLVCDPVAGLVEVPCVKRNVIGAVNAVTSAELAMAQIRSRISPDQVIDAMRSVGHALPESLRETAKGGLAVTPDGLAIAKHLKEQNK